MESSHRIADRSIVISEEARARLHAFQAALQDGMDRDGADRVSHANVSLVEAPALTRAALGLSSTPQGIDLSHGGPALSNADFHWNDLTGLLNLPGLSAEDRSRLSSALTRATAADQQVSSDPAIDLTLRKMKLDYIRDNMVPEPFRAQADVAISSYVSHHVADQDRMTGMLTQRMVEVTREAGLTEQTKSLEQELSDLGQGTASSQLVRSRMLGIAQGQDYRSPAKADSASAQVIATIKATMLEAVAKWPREQERGRTEVNAQISRIQKKWNGFVQSMR